MRGILLVVVAMLLLGCMDKHYEITQPIEAESPYSGVRPGVWFDMEYISTKSGWSLVGYKVIRDNGRVQQWRWIEEGFTEYEVTNGNTVGLRPVPHWESEYIDSVDVSWWYEKGADSD